MGLSPVSQCCRQADHAIHHTLCSFKYQFYLDPGEQELIWITGGWNGSKFVKIGNRHIIQMSKTMVHAQSIHTVYGHTHMQANVLLHGPLKGLSNSLQKIVLDKSFGYVSYIRCNENVNKP